MIEIHENTPLLKLNTFGIDIKANRFCSAATIEDVLVLQQLGAFQEKFLILGGGSNILFTKDFDGLVIKNEIKGYEVIKQDEAHVWLKIGAGETWNDMVRHTISSGWQGLENLTLIPGTVGAAPIQNIGAYGVEQKDLFEELMAVELATGKKVFFTNEDSNFGYRDSFFKRTGKGKYLITHVTYKLNKCPNFNIAYGAIREILEERQVKEVTTIAISDAVSHIRSNKLPDPTKIGNAGSFFKNPVVNSHDFERLKKAFPAMPAYLQDGGRMKVPAGWLIEHSGWKGKVFGNVGVHKDQALVLVNFGGAKGGEVYDLSEKIVQSVMRKFDIVLEREVNII